jgi:hypothetical protein
MKHFLFLFFFLACAHKGHYRNLSSGRLHESCYQQFGNEAALVIREGIERGMLCLERLKGVGARKNTRLLKKLFASGTLTYQCNEKKFPWGHLQARASHSKDANVEAYSLKHPFISIRPGFQISSREELEKVLFHEYFHNVGFSHNASVEYAYACEECCFSERPEHHACMICSKDYAGISDPNYIRDFWEWVDLSKTPMEISKGFTIRSALYHADDKAPLWYYLLRDKFQGNLVTKFFSEELITKKLSTDPLVMERSLMKIPKKLEFLIPLSREAAKARFSLLMNKDLDEASRIYHDLDIKPLQLSLRLFPKKNSSAYKGLLNIWDGILYDLDLLMFELQYKEPDHFEEIGHIYETLMKARPL